MESDRAATLAYSALLGEIGWQAVLDEIVGAAGVDMGTLFYHDVPSGRGAIMLGSGISEAVERDYSSHFAPLNPWMSLVSSTPIGKGVVGEQILSRSRFLRTEYYNDFLRPHDQESSVGVTVRNDDGCFFLLSVLSGDTDFDRNRKRADYLTRVSAHMRRTSDFYRRQAAGAYEGVAAGVGSMTGIATIVVNAAARVVHASPLGERKLALGDTLGADAAGAVFFRDSMAQSIFGHALRGRLTDLMTKTVTAGDSEVTFVRAAEDTGSRVFMGGTLAILIADRARRRVDGTDRVASAYGLTPAEKRVMGGIVAGRSISEIASGDGVGVETVRSQLKAVYAKTGTNRQAALVRLVAGLADSNDDGHEAFRKR